MSDDPMLKVVHAQTNGGTDYTLCGYSIDGEWGYSEVPIAEAGQIVTCEGCKSIINYCKTFKRNHQP